MHSLLNHFSHCTRSTQYLSLLELSKETGACCTAPWLYEQFACHELLRTRVSVRGACPHSGLHSSSTTLHCPPAPLPVLRTELRSTSYLAVAWPSRGMEMLFCKVVGMAIASSSFVETCICPDPQADVGLSAFERRAL
jgi:hypothetical protein